MDIKSLMRRKSAEELPAGQAKADRVYRVFESIASGYDAANNRISLGLQKRWKRALTDTIVHRAPRSIRVLDVCCGTGDIAIALAQRGPGFCVTGLDFSPAMLEVAGKKGQGITNLQLLQGDAMKLPFADGTFDAACISFGLRNTPDYRRVLREMRRVVRTGGKVYCLDSFVPDNPVILPAYRLYFRHIMPVLGGGRKYRKQYTWLYQSTEQFPRRRELMKQFARTGLVQVQSRSRMLGACVLIEGTKA
jgi:demethylmenaquinone methyltransferase/2-methoxy-6-polyprenyl-1,4-benzoquinol methylase